MAEKAGGGFMRYRQLGRTGLQVSEVGFGAIPIIRLSFEEAERVLRRALDRGVTLFDTAHLYVDSEEKIGRAFEGLRDRIVLATKTMKRDKQGAQEDLELSLRRLRTDYLDLYQFHMVNQEADIQAITGPGGALEAAVRAKEAGRIRHLGFTSHSLEMAIKLVKTELFSTVQFPFNFIEAEATAELHPLAWELKLGVLAMKPFCGGLVEDARVAFAYLRRFPAVIPLAGWDSVERVDEVVDLYEQPLEVTPEDEAAMARYRTELGDLFCRRCEYCQPCPHGVMVTPAMLYGTVAHRMGPAKAAAFAAKAMESVRLCEECGECAERCPYHLPIPETLKKHLAMYEEHLGK
ncbi:MAG: aldo/keto reductase [Syntrophales bacterium]|nr:aldo/keto reductase [Syntrophales bacterium]